MPDGDLDEADAFKAECDAMEAAGPMTLLSLEWHAEACECDVCKAFDEAKRQAQAKDK